MITEEMKKETEEFSTLMDKTIEKRRPEPRTMLHPELTEQSMHKMMSKPSDDLNNVYVRIPLRRPRDFFNDSWNSETKLVFEGRIRNSTATTKEFRAKYAGQQDPEAKYLVQTAGDLAYRHMVETHKKEWQLADNEIREGLKFRHAFENSYFAYQEAKVKKSPEIEDALRNTLSDYRSFSAHKLAIKTDQQVINPRVEIKPLQQPRKQNMNTDFRKVLEDYKAKRTAEKPEVKQDVVVAKNAPVTELGAVQPDMERMRQKYGYGKIANKEQVQKNIQTMRR